MLGRSARFGCTASNHIEIATFSRKCSRAHAPVSAACHPYCYILGGKELMGAARSFKINKLALASYKNVGYNALF